MARAAPIAGGGFAVTEAEPSRPSPKPSSAPEQAAPGPTASDVAAAQDMTPEDRLAMVQGMVAQLDAKLRENPKDAEGWRRLVRSYMVLGQEPLARDALSRGIAAFGAGTAEAAALTDFEQQRSASGNGYELMTRKQKRLSVIGTGLGFLTLATVLVFYALGAKASYFYMPGDLKAAMLEPGQRIHLGGLVSDGSIVRGQGTKVSFGVTDTWTVTYDGILPDLFREGQGVITEGAFGGDGVFVADTCLPSTTRPTCRRKLPTA